MFCQTLLHQTKWPLAVNEFVTPASIVLATRTLHHTFYALILLDDAKYLYIRL